MKGAVPPYARIERIIRDIPSTSILGVCRITNLRETVQQRMRERGLRCQCIRCRQVRGRADGRYELTRRTYAASGGTELFLSYEDPSTNRLAAFLRLRIPHGEAPRAYGEHDRPVGPEAPWTPVLAGAALVRELPTYGQHLPLH